jgi:hypothetical protein
MSEEKTESLLQLLVVEQQNSRRELKTIRELMSRFVNDMTRAESEVPEQTRRFATYMHDLNDMAWMYEQRGLPVPPWILREMERCDDRFRQLQDKLHTDGGAFEKIRREMASDPLNRWDHTRLLDKPKENGNEAGKSES